MTRVKRKVKRESVCIYAKSLEGINNFLPVFFVVVIINNIVLFMVDVKK